MKTVDLFMIEYVPNNLGVWDRKWFLSEIEAGIEYRRLLREEGYQSHRNDGEWGSISPPVHVPVELSAEGLLEFANSHAVDQAY